MRNNNLKIPSLLLRRQIRQIDRYSPLRKRLCSSLFMCSWSRVSGKWFIRYRDCDSESFVESWCDEGCALWETDVGLDHVELHWDQFFRVPDRSEERRVGKECPV